MVAIASGPFVLARWLAWLIADTLEHGQRRIFTETSICFGSLTHDKRAAFGALDDFNMLAGGAQADEGRNFHQHEFSMKLPLCKKLIGRLAFSIEYDYHLSIIVQRRDSMRIESFHIQGFKSIADVKVEGLSDINVFYGLNDVGKSNIFQALASCYLTVANKGKHLEQLEAEFGAPLFQLRGNDTIRLEVEVILDRSDFPDHGMLFDLMMGKVVLAKVGDITSQFASLNEIRVVIGTEIKSHPRGIQAPIVIRAHVGKVQFDLSQRDLPSSFFNFHIIQAVRRFQVEQRKNKNDQERVSDHNLKQALFYAYLSSDQQQKQRLAAIKRILADPPFSLGELDIALDPVTDRIDIGFVRPDGRLPLENLGSGSQQLLLVLGQIFLNDYPIIAIEEPEMNLSPQYQQYLLIALRQLMQDPAVKLNQLFISTHSPYFEFEENFFDVTLDEDGATQVTRLPIEKRDRYFPDTEVGPDTGARLNSLNQVKLYDGLIKDLRLQRGDLVLFTKNEAGHWEIRPEREIVQELETVFNDEDGQ